jgi:hypothetical protein
MTNILFFSLVKSEYNITYDRDAFIIHRVAKGYSDMVSSPTSVGCMCMIRTTPEVVILSWRQWRKMSLKFQSRLCWVKWSIISSVQWVLAGTAKFKRRTNHAMVW